MHEEQVKLSAEEIAKRTEQIIALRKQGMSYHQITQWVSLHWTRVAQIVKEFEATED